mmetsp:Transcript_41225/g.78753  ORF Transcript_41225/g.78753 Transcript_41225/m.78753 type:complete len:442 (+) Transcript_41225:140-1465(+)|eukprot:CAMPEP_0114254044 /NCGR_PEP_ID=MMETSP0058-20121206/16752_1 /TAXON_ID=36894 /ORGANISM="Pyramimonas parkeae, CCMP726" /LENGTH=441 /DNA_ID=CAMNT_0001368203 /DNA_START=100 /DNA_END=1425 /DNA_ORIENTATION=-
MEEEYYHDDAEEYRLPPTEDNEFHKEQMRPTTAAYLGNGGHVTPEMEDLREASRQVMRPQTDPGHFGASESRSSRLFYRSQELASKKLLMNFVPPSSRYPEVEAPSRALLMRASTPPNPVLPRRPAPHRHSAAARATSGAARRGDMEGKNGGKYQGEVLAGRPHGQGQYWTPSGATMKLQYEGEWVQGMREGYGTLYYWTGETYHGEMVQNKRHGQGRMEYKCGDVYEGQFRKDRRHGMGSHYYANGDCFVGYYCADRREGLGTIYWLSRAKKYEGEWRGDRPCTGHIKALSEEEEDHLARERLTSVAISRPLPEPVTFLPLPKLALKAPNQVVFGQALDVRKSRRSGRAEREAQKRSGTLDDSTMERLKHSFIALAGGDGPKEFIRPSKIGDVCVLAGLDPAAPEVPVLLRSLHDHSRRDAKLTFDDFLNVLVNFRCMLE